MKIKIDGYLMFGEYNEQQIEIIYKETLKPQNKRRYIMGIDFSRIKEVEVLKWKITI